jgi:hypothetical protein
VASDSVTVTWSATLLPSGFPVDGYTVKRYDAVTLAAQTIGSACAGPITVSPCTETGVPVGQWVYTVTPRVGASWTGPASPPSDAVVIAPATSPLGAAAAFSVLGGAGVTSTGFTTVSGDLGTSPSAAVVGFPPGIVAGTIHAGDPTAAQAQADLTVAYNTADNLTPDTEFAGDLNGRTFFAGVHHSTAAMALTGNLTLDGQSNPNAVFIFQVDAALNTAAASHVNLINGAQAANVSWQVVGAAGIGANSTFAGTIMAAGAITIGAGTELIGRALAKGMVTLDSNTIRFTAATPPTITITGGSTAVTKDSTPTLAGTSSAAPGRTVTTTIAGQTLTTTVLANGTWSATAAVLLAGTYPVVASVRDAAGNAGRASQTLTVEVNPDPVNLRTTATFSLLAGVLGVTNNGLFSTSTVAGDVGATPGIVTGFPLGAIAGSVYVLLHATAVQAQADLTLAYNDADSRIAHTEFSGDLNGRTFRAGVHHTAAAMALTGTMTLDGEGDPNAVFIFQVDAALNTAAASQITLTNGAQASNVYWQVLGAAGTGANSTFVGTILANGAITLGNSTDLFGRALSKTSVLMTNTTVRFTP